MAADHENHIKRLTREYDDRIKYANQKLLEKFLPVLDNFDLALSHADTASAESMAEGIKLTHKSLIDALGKSGMEIITVEVGSPFDPTLHEGIMLTNNPELPDNSVAMVVQNGYRLAGRVLRPVKVQVNKVG
jgi:molecular chaperone GrpE